MTTLQDELTTVLSAAAAERLAILQRHEAGARVVSHYDFNNTYQYIISREETHLQWLQSALEELGATMPPPDVAIPVPAMTKKSKRAEPGDFRGILEDDVRTLHAFVQRWRPRVEGITHARHRLMMNVVLGETMEHARLFEQAASGFEDVLGRRTERAARVGGVLPARWQE